MTPPTLLDTFAGMAKPCPHCDSTRTRKAGCPDCAALKALVSVLDRAPAGTLTERLTWLRSLGEHALVEAALKVNPDRRRAAKALGVVSTAVSRAITRHPSLARRYPVATGRPRKG